MKIELDKIKKLDIEDGDILVIEADSIGVAYEIKELFRKSGKKIGILKVTDIDKIGVLKLDYRL